MPLGDVPPTKIYMDSMASFQMANLEGILHNPSPYHGLMKVTIGDGSLLPIRNTCLCTFHFKMYYLFFIWHVV